MNHNPPKTPRGSPYAIWYNLATSCCSAAAPCHLAGVADRCPPKAQATRSNRVGCAIYTRARYRDLQAAFPRCRVAPLICESEESTRRWTSALKPTSIGCGLPQIPAGTSNKTRSPHPERRQIRDEHLISRSLRIKQSACEHYDLNEGVVLRSNIFGVLAH